jgi:hypothetical protein
MSAVSPPMMGAGVHLTLLITLSVYHEIRDDTDQAFDYLYIKQQEEVREFHINHLEITYHYRTTHCLSERGVP